MSFDIEKLLNKVTNENIEIGCRAIDQILRKITNGLIILEQIDDNIGYKFLFVITRWLEIFLNNYKRYKYDPTLVINVLNLYLRCMNIFPPSATQTLKRDFKISSIINDLGALSPELSKLCEKIQYNLSKNALDTMSARNTRNFSQTANLQEEVYSNRNTYNYTSNFAESYGPRNNIEDFNSKNMNNTQPEGFRSNINISNVNHTVNFNKMDNQNAQSNILFSNTIPATEKRKYKFITFNKSIISYSS